MSVDPQDIDNPAQPAAQPAAPTWRCILRWAIFIVVIVFVGRALIERFSAISWTEIKFTPRYLALAAACILLGMVFRVVTYRGLLACACEPPSWLDIFAIAWIPPIGKYIPGKVASVIGAVWMLGRRGVPGSVAFSVVLMMQGFSTVLGLALAAPLTLWQPIRQRLPLAWLWCLLLVVAGVVCLHPKIFRALANYFLRRIHHEPLQTSLGVRNYGLPLMTTFASSTLAGMALYLTARSVTQIPLHSIPFFISAFALASTVGFLAVFAPGGLGVREGILLVVLGPVIGAEYAAIVAVASRLLVTIVEVILAGIGLAIFRSLWASKTASG